MPGILRHLEREPTPARYDAVGSINVLLKDIASNDNDGIGKPEPLKHGFHGYWSRRITDEQRLIYKVEHDEIRIAGCRCRYGR
ncbi:Txe/YoeB family addiction module toxin [Agromyces laixinhei]|uniref:Txe/YoeB family addiction module toxin n=1 Tax=Agromyces laixinhei TaxID=2585717 RepID=UPI0012ED159D|nr:Txe/YoeB family addiction module toxin [Agromyces laixinhei]